ncbi:DUF1769 domain-containing protein [Skeletonema marinoi]|uniref:DUF1769 domain-containing protein n=2 Tax=Skeletonema marinoi TaxID=267567 RepID=A0AAD9D8N7_9STRA|nr:DUF1769 domain-containing protein [Skeletonema marinoi]
MTQNSSVATYSSSGSDVTNARNGKSPQDSTAHSPLNYADAHKLAIRLRDGMRTHTKDRKWRFKQYRNCFKASHAIDWSMKNEVSEIVAVQRLNELISFGFLCHVVDPNKTIRVGETRTLYFRMVDDLIDDDIGANNPDQNHLIDGKVGNSTRTVCSANTISLQLKLDGVNHVLQETVAELNATQGKMEMLQQQVLSLVSNQISMMGIIILLYLYIVFVSVVHQFVPGVSGFWWWLGFTLLPIAILVASVVCGMRCQTMWSDVDSSNLIAPMGSIETETSATAEDIGDSIIHTEKSRLIHPQKSFVRRQSITSMISKSMSSLMNRKSMRRLSSGIDKSILHAREAYSLPDVEEWPHRPLFVCLNTPVCSNHKIPEYGLGACPIGVPFKFESDLFVGQCLIRLKGASSDDPEGDEEYFTGRKRIFQSVIQGQFKEKVNVADVLTGHEFARPLKNLPHPWVLKTATNFIGKVTPGANIVVHTNQPHVEALLSGSSQVIRGDMPGNEPEIACKNLVEDCSVLGGAFKDGNVPVARRKRILSNPARCKEYSFDCETVYTFEFYQNLFDASSYSLDLGFTKIGCSKVLDSQPIQWLGKMRDGRYLWSFQIWHEKLLKAAASYK